MSSWSNTDIIYTQLAKLPISSYLFGQFPYLTFTNLVFELHLQICNHASLTIRETRKPKGWMSVKDKTTEKRGGQVESEGDDDNDNDDEVGDGEGDGDNALKQNVTRIKDVIKQVEFEG